MSILDNIGRIQNNIRSITSRPVTLVAVTKKRRVTEIDDVIQGGISIIAESRWQEAKDKISALTAPVQKHFIGHLQSNKVAPVVQYFDLIQSIDSVALALKVNAEAMKLNKIMPVLIEVNTSKEPQKFGMKPEDLVHNLREMSSLLNLRVEGLMTMAAYDPDPETARPSFRLLRELFEYIQSLDLPRITMKTLSMGMSDDYLIALQEGATMIRIGRGIFGGANL